MLCPTTSFVCSATDFSATTLRWFFDNELFAIYSYIPTDEYPLTIVALSQNYSAEIGGAEIHILDATQSADDLDRINIISTITLNITALEAARVFNISCGSFTIQRTISIEYMQGL